VGDPGAWEAAEADAAQERKRRRDAGASSEREDAGVEESGGEEGGRRRKDKVTSTTVMEVSARCLFVCVVSMDSCGPCKWLPSRHDVCGKGEVFIKSQGVWDVHGG